MKTGSLSFIVYFSFFLNFPVYPHDDLSDDPLSKQTRKSPTHKFYKSVEDKVSIYADSARKYNQQALLYAERNNLDNDKAIALFHQGCINYRNYLYDQALESFDQSLHHFQDQNDLRSISLTKVQIAIVYIKKNRFQESFKILSEALDISKSVDDINVLAKVYEELGRTYFYVNDFKKALGFHFQALEIFINTNHIEGITSAYNNIGLINRVQKNYDKAFHYFYQSIPLSKEINDQESLSMGYYNIGATYIQKKQPDSALMYYTKSLKICHLYGMKWGMAIAHDKIGMVHNEKKEFKLSHYHLSKSLELFSEIRDSAGINQVYLDLGKTYELEGNISKAINYYNECVLLSQKTNDIPRLNNANLWLAEIYKKDGLFEQAYEHFKAYQLYTEQLYDIEKSKQIEYLQYEFETELKDKEITLLQQDKKINEDQLSRRKTYIITLILIINIAGLFIYIIFNRYRQKKRNELVQLEKINLKNRQHIELAEIKSRFFTNISHEFRTPLTLIISPVEHRLKTNISDILKQEYEMIYRNATRLLEYINQILDLSRLEHNSLPLQAEKADINRFVKEVTDHFLPLAEVRKLSLKFDTFVQESEIYFDKHKMSQVITNILSNAFKHTTHNDCIHVTISEYNNSEKKFRQWIQISIKDNGEGIPGESVEYIFNRFYQCNSTECNGSGIGLSLVKELVELHGGEINVQSHLNSGTEFIINLPKGSSHLKEDQIIAASIGSESFSFANLSNTESQHNDYPSLDKINFKGDKPLILITEDNNDVRKYLCSILSKEYNCIEARDGIEGIEIASRLLPDLIISDIMMPHSDGYSFVRWIKNDIETCHIPVILLTAKVSTEHRTKGWEKGADAYITKPFVVQELLALCQNLIAIRKKMQLRLLKDNTIEPSEITTNSIDKEFLQKACAVVEKNMSDENFSLRDFHEQMNVSYSTLHRKIKALTSQSTTHFIRLIKLKHAAQLIVNSDWSISKISEAVGFNSLQFFSKCFKQQFGLSPTDYKHKHENANMDGCIL